MYANILEFHIWIPHEKIGDPYFFFLSELSPILEFFNQLNEMLLELLPFAISSLLILLLFLCIA